MGKSVAIDLIKMSPMNGKEGQLSGLFIADFPLTLLSHQLLFRRGETGRRTTPLALLGHSARRASTAERPRAQVRC
jgi:hypothetical protein